jgi:hypothetical protein
MRISSLYYRPPARYLKILRGQTRYTMMCALFSLPDPSTNYFFPSNNSSNPLIPPSNPSTSYSFGYRLITSRISSTWLRCSAVNSSHTPSNAFLILGFFSFSAASKARRTSLRVLLRSSFSRESLHSSRPSSHLRSRVMGLSRRFQSSTSTRWRYANESSDVL